MVLLNGFPAKLLNGGTANSWDSHAATFANMAPQQKNGGSPGSKLMNWTGGRFQSLPLFCIQKCLIGFVDFEKNPLRGWIIIATGHDTQDKSNHSHTLNFNQTKPHNGHFPTGTASSMASFLACTRNGNDTRAVDMIPGDKTDLWRGSTWELSWQWSMDIVNRKS